jgi:hypothetical protein
VHLTVYMISYNLFFKKDMLTLTSYTSLYALTLNHDHEMERIIFPRFHHSVINAIPAPLLKHL